MHYHLGWKYAYLYKNSFEAIIDLQYKATKPASGGRWINNSGELPFGGKQQERTITVDVRIPSWKGQSEETSKWNVVLVNGNGAERLFVNDSTPKCSQNDDSSLSCLYFNEKSLLSIQLVQMVG